MYRSSPARKYGPLALLAAVQLVVVLVAPSTAPTEASAVAAGAPVAVGGDGSAALPGEVGGDVGVVAGPDGGTDGGSPATPGGTAGTATDPGGGGGSGTTGAGTGGGGSAGTGGSTPVTAGTGSTAPGPTGSNATTGDVSHCVAGREFDPKIEYFAPPCVPGRPGAAVPNAGATSQGVTKDKIVVVHYIPDYGAEVNAILRAQGLFYDASNARIANAAYQSFMNKNYNLAGRKIDIKTFQGTCRTVPPDQQCLNGEMNRIAKQFKPYAVFFQTTVCSACFAELARLKVVTFGGAGFSEEFRNALKPYNYDYGVSSTKMSKLFAQWWCGQLNGKPAVFAGAQNAAQDFRKTTRQLGVVSTNDPDNERVIRKVLYPALSKGCGASVKGHEYFYEQNVGTAATQSQAGTAVMNSPNNPATSVVCFCDPVAPQFSYNAATNNNYWPEVLFASNQAQDTDPAGQTYEGDLACPQRSRGCAFDGALGLGSAEKSVAPAALGGVKVFQRESKAALPLQPAILEIFWQNYNMFASLLQMTGSTLTPANMAAAAPRLGSRGGGSTGLSRRAFVNGELSWTQDVLVTYFNKNRTSPYNNVKGAFAQAYGGKRFGLGQFPGAAQPPVPTVAERR